MKFQIIEEKENPMLKRKEILISLDYEKGSTPSKAELQKILAEQLNVNIENVEISKVLSEIGLPRGKAWVKIWQEKKVPIYSEMEKKKKEVKKMPEEKPKEEVKPEEQKEEPKPEKAPEKQAEEKPEEPKPEEVKEPKPEEKKEVEETKTEEKVEEKTEEQKSE